MKIFRAFRGYWATGGGEVFVYAGEKRVGRLNPHFEVMNKSPTGFAWGYEGSGPAQLSFALLAAVIGTKRAQSPSLFQEFKRQVIARLDKESGFEITELEILTWVRRRHSGEPPNKFRALTRATADR